MQLPILTKKTSYNWQQSKNKRILINNFVEMPTESTIKYNVLFLFKKLKCQYLLQYFFVLF